ncbi:DNA polymerase III subunit delta [secondary endosymbiont of Ctenarytaina eucalypti]|uniref:DNA polymerase III subunit delta n=1 Tax=secondary endosymbiont of Ctenarytaina eucalypti TaxID=1199245 RepID=J3TXJ2_9ENTR|nr:DNA polymerase III subunit delta [secondary endosymbiont of Ctenarytaina eucalypti]AFP84905.1 DNA polymerase III, delta subunit [secondary endosymbiont of Ctenarytaina eucalypti]
MIRLYAEQLDAKLQESLGRCYFLFGNEPLLLQESQSCIRSCAQNQQFEEHVSITLDATTDWYAIFSLCRERSLFARRQTLLLILPENGLQAPMGDKLLELISLLHEDLLLIVRGNKLTRSLENSRWFKALSAQAVLVRCITPEQEELSHWVANRAKSMHLTLDDVVCQTLCYYYENNLLALAQVLERLSLIYPDGYLTLPRVKGTLNDSAHFTPFHWVDAAIAGRNKRAMRILWHLQIESAQPALLLRSMQHEVLQLLTFKRNLHAVPIGRLFDRHKVWQNRRPLLTLALERLTFSQLRKAVALMVHIELALKQDYDYSIWSNLNALALLLCGNTLPTGALDD